MEWSNDILNKVYDKTSGYCYHCGKKLTWKNYGMSKARGAWEVDHSNPLSKGGTDYLRNLVPACINCNRSKGDMTSQQFRRTFEDEHEENDLVETLLALVLIPIGIAFLHWLFNPSQSHNRQNRLPRYE